MEGIWFITFTNFMCHLICYPVRQLKAILKEFSRLLLAERICLNWHALLLPLPKLQEAINTVTESPCIKFLGWQKEYSPYFNNWLNDLYLAIEITHLVQWDVLGSTIHLNNFFIWNWFQPP